MIQNPNPPAAPAPAPVLGVLPLRFSADAPAMIAFLRTLGMAAEVTTAGEDFAEFARSVPSAFAFVGTGNAAKGTDYPQHHPKFDVDEEALPAAAELFVRSALAFLAK